jgi:hypothetical protein
LKAQRSSLTIVVLLLLSLGLPNAIAATKPKAAGRTSTAVINTVLNGKGAPTKSIGIDGDFYIDTRSLLISGPKTKGKWPTARSLQGANGVNGVNGSNGSDGKNGSDAKNISTASTVAGPVGPKGAPGTNGSDGAAGSRGSDGSNGANGSVGATGATGPAGSGATGAAGANGSDGAAGARGSDGSNGVNGSVGATGATGAVGSNGTNGSNGANGTDGATGSTGPTGPTGATGARGDTGTAGVPEIRVGTLVFTSISGAAGSSSISNLDGLKAGKSYLIRFLIHTYLPTNRIFDAKMPLNFSSAATSGSPVMTKHFVSSSSNSYRNGVEGFEWSLNAEVILDGSLVATDYGISITVTVGKSTGSETLAIICDFSALLVGEVK